MPQVDPHPRLVAKLAPKDGKRTRYTFTGIKGLQLDRVPNGAQSTRHMAFGEIEHLAISNASRFGATSLEGVIVRRDGTEFLEERAKLVRPDFTQAIGEHWRSRHTEWNSVTPA